MDFDIKRRSRVCARTEKELGPGETYFSVLVEREDEVVREEISSSAWDGPPENCISWWKARIPERDPNKFFWAPDNVIIDYFESFLDDETKSVERYVLCLLLIQKRIFRLTDTETDDEGRESMYLTCARRNTEYEVEVAEPSPEEVEDVQQELVELLFSDEPFEDNEVLLDEEDSATEPESNPANSETED